MKTSIIKKQPRSVITLLSKPILSALILSALILSACQQDDATSEILPDPPAGEAGEVTLNFTVAGDLSIPGATPPATRTELPGSANTQHVNAVQLYIFNGTADNALCVSSEDIGWSAHFAGLPPTVTANMRYRVKYTGLVKGNPYTFLAVGTDTSSRTAYGYPAAIQVNTTTLAGAIATLTGAEATTWTNIRQAELFAGAVTLTPDAYGAQGNVDLWRRVAGVMGWFNNVPTTINSTPVAYIRVTLYTQQNKSVPLIARSQTPVFKDYIASPLANTTTGGKVLTQIPVPPGTLPITVLSKGSYVLPVPAPPAVNANDYTLRVELTDAAGNTLRSTRVTLSGTDDSNSSTGGGTGVIDPQGVYRFPIIANRFYGVGTPTSPISLAAAPTRSSIRAIEVTNHFPDIKIEE